MYQSRDPQRLLWACTVWGSQEEVVNHNGAVRQTQGCIIVQGRKASLWRGENSVASCVGKMGSPFSNIRIPPWKKRQGYLPLNWQLLGYHNLGYPPSPPCQWPPRRLSILVGDPRVALTFHWTCLESRINMPVNSPTLRIYLPILVVTGILGGGITPSYHPFTSMFVGHPMVATVLLCQNVMLLLHNWWWDISYPPIIYTYIYIS